MADSECVRVLLFMLLCGCVTSGVTITLQPSGAVMMVDVDGLPAGDAERAVRISELAAQTCGAATAQVQLDLDRVVTTAQRRPATSAWVQGAQGQTALNARSTIPPTAPQEDERATHVAVPVLEVVVVCGG